MTTRDANPTTAGGGPDTPVELMADGVRLPLYVLLFCLFAEFMFFVLDYHINYGHGIEMRPIRHLFSTTTEDGFASWYAISQTLLSALTLWLIFVLARARGEARWTVLGWLVLAVFFTYMSFDDGTKFHERIGSAYKIFLRSQGESTTFFPSYFWQLVFLPFFGVMGLFLLAFLWYQLRDRLSRILLVASIALLVCAVGLDFIEGLDEDHRWNLYTIITEAYDIEDFCERRFGKSGFDTLRHFSKSIEEVLLEMPANSLLWYLFLRRLTLVANNVRIRFTGG